MNADPTIRKKQKILEERLLSLGKVAVAFSSGVDSTFLLKTAHDLLGADAVAVTALGCIFPSSEQSGSGTFCRDEGIELFTFDARPLEIPGFKENPPDRCYICKRSLFTKIKDIASSLGIEHVLDGTNADDSSDYRPGMRAVKELGIISPLKEARLTKSEIRVLSREAGLASWGKPSCACLASRIATGENITVEKLSMVDRAEEYLKKQGFGQLRVRIHGTVARIELDPCEFPRILEKSEAEKIYSELKDIGFSFVALDLLGYRTGSMNVIKADM